MYECVRLKLQLLLIKETKTKSPKKSRSRHRFCQNEIQINSGSDKMCFVFLRISQLVAPKLKFITSNNVLRNQQNLSQKLKDRKENPIKTGTCVMLLLHIGPGMNQYPTKITNRAAMFYFH